jgi:hypothetical protein
MRPETPQPPETKPSLPAAKCAECNEHASFRFTWPGQKPAHLCDRHMALLAENADPNKLAVEPLGDLRLIPVAIPGGEIEWRVVPK